MRTKGSPIDGGRLVGLDVGSTVIKAAAFDSSGRLVACAARSVPILRPRPDWMERDAEATWRAAAAVLRAVAARAGRVAAVGLAGCGNGAILVGAGGRVLRRGILSGDTRTAGMAGRRPPSGGARAYPGQTACLLRWLEAKEPAVIKRTAALLFWKDFVRLRLTGVIATDYTDAGASGLLDCQRRRWRRRRAFLPPLRGSTEAAGRITAQASARVGLPAGTPVFTGAIDCEATALGSGISEKGELSIVAGTWAISQTFSRKPTPPGALFLCNPSSQAGRWLLLEGSPGSAANFEWAVRVLLGKPEVARALRMAAGAKSGRLVFVPGISSGSGSLAGLDAADGAGELLRAVMEGTVHSHRLQVEALAAASSKFTRVRFAGGASRSPLWARLFADGLGLPVTIPRGAELGALGAALFAGVGIGRWRSLAEAQRETVRLGRTFAPTASGRESMNRGYRAFKEIQAKLHRP